MIKNVCLNLFLVFFIPKWKIKKKCEVTTERVNDASRLLQRSPLTCLNLITSITDEMSMPVNGITFRMSVLMTASEARDARSIEHWLRFVIIVSFELFFSMYFNSKCMVLKVCMDLFISLIISNAFRALILIKNHFFYNFQTLFDFKKI